jgi:hypothetical protein
MPRTGPAFASDGPLAGGTADRVGSHLETIVQQAGGKYKEVTKRSKMYCAINATARALHSSFGTAVPFLIYNPVGSGIRCILKKVVLTMGVTGTQQNGRISHGKITINGPGGSQAGVVPTGTAVTPQNLDIGGPNASAMTVLEQATVVAGVELYPFMETAADVAATTVNPNRSLYGIGEDVDGNIVLEPGGGWFLDGIGAGGSSPLAFIGAVWEEEGIAS